VHRDGLDIEPELAQDVPEPPAVDHVLGHDLAVSELVLGGLERNLGSRVKFENPVQNERTCATSHCRYHASIGTEMTVETVIDCSTAA
jgi:hypothetical protein